MNRVQVGHELGEFYMLKFLGVDPNTGDAIFKDVDGDGVITSNDQTFVGSPHPDYSGGLTNEFTWKGVDLSFLLTFSQGNKVLQRHADLQCVRRCLPRQRVSRPAEALAEARRPDRCTQGQLRRRVGRLR